MVRGIGLLVISFFSSGRLTRVVVYMSALTLF